MRGGNGLKVMKNKRRKRDGAQGGENKEQE